MSSDSKYGFATRAIHAGAAPDPTTGARGTPIHQTTAYVFKDADHAAALFGLEEAGFIYSRLTNPTVSVFQDRVASLEGGVGATCTASGHSAQLLALFALMNSGDEFVASNKLYGGSITQFGHSFKKFGWQVHFVDPVNPENFRKAITPKTKAVFTESLANPGGVICDIEAIASIAHAAGIPCIVDNTLPSPALCRPFEYGADIVVHSTTKFISGHGNAMGGAVVDSGNFDWSQNDKFPDLVENCGAYHGLNFYETFGKMAYTMFCHAVGLRDLGPSMSPMNAYLSLTGAETLPLRMQKHADNALEVAKWLQGHAQVSWVSYAGLPDNEFYSLAQKYCPKGAGSVFTFGVKGGYEMGLGVVSQCKLLSHLANIGDTRSLIIHPASTTHRQLTEEQQISAGAGPDVVRLSIGIEDAADVIADLDQALVAST
ncbi:MAG: O-acetylhomoserine aminocarboxypropyltransferase [Gammaproteobacteria bacterium]|nr:O-acetylhomoserine aminocarboxypropyltransferase [Gammaproteobacteria bacterium]